MEPGVAQVAQPVTVHGQVAVGQIVDQTIADRGLQLLTVVRGQGQLQEIDGAAPQARLLEKQGHPITQEPAGHRVDAGAGGEKRARAGRNQQRSRKRQGETETATVGGARQHPSVVELDGFVRQSLLEVGVDGERAVHLFDGSIQIAGGGEDGAELEPGRRVVFVDDQSVLQDRARPVEIAPRRGDQSQGVARFEEVAIGPHRPAQLLIGHMEIACQIPLHTHDVTHLGGSVRQIVGPPDGLVELPPVPASERRQPEAEVGPGQIGIERRGLAEILGSLGEIGVAERRRPRVDQVVGGRVGRRIRRGCRGGPARQQGGERGQEQGAGAGRVAERAASHQIFSRGA